jgi:hypothetical protein
MPQGIHGQILHISTRGKAWAGPSLPCLPSEAPSARRPRALNVLQHLGGTTPILARPPRFHFPQPSAPFRPKNASRPPDPVALWEAHQCGGSPDIPAQAAPTGRENVPAQANPPARYLHPSSCEMCATSMMAIPHHLGSVLGCPPYFRRSAPLRFGCRRCVLNTFRPVYPLDADTHFEGGAGRLKGYFALSPP